jgi:CheY-like chemotaxis protein
LAEDNPLSQKVAKLQLTKLGFQVKVVATGREALAAALRRHYDLIFMDCQMPELNGYEATSELRRHEAPGIHSKVIAMTAHTLPGEREKCLAAGMDAYICKPLSQEALATALTELFPDCGNAGPGPALPSASQAADSHPLTLGRSAGLHRSAMQPEAGSPAVATAQSLPQGEQGLAAIEDEGPPNPTTPALPGAAPAWTNTFPNGEARPSETSSDTCDRATLADLRAEGGTLLAELVAIFQTELTKSLEALRHALEDRDAAAVARVAHTLKGTAATFGATSMREQAAMIDQSARTGQIEQAAQMFETFRSECESVRTYLASAIEGQPTDGPAGS